jgi:hypothetical protein
MRISGIAAAAYCLLIASPALTQQETPRPMPLDEREAREAVSEKLGELAQALLRMRDLRKSQCMKAMGSEELCTCIADESPSGIDFVDYVRIVSSSKTDLKYNALSPNDKRLVDATRASRDKCVLGHEQP